MFNLSDLSIELSPRLPNTKKLFLWLSGWDDQSPKITLLNVIKQLYKQFLNLKLLVGYHDEASKS